MTPRPQCHTTIIRTNRRLNTNPPIYAICAGPQRGVHLLSTEQLPSEIQYLYRHPINVHPSFLTITGDFLRRKFESIEAAVKWIDDYDREMELAKAFEGASLQGVEAKDARDVMGNGKEKERADVIEKMENRRVGNATVNSALRTRRASDPGNLLPNVGADHRGKIEKKRPLSEKKVVAVRGRRVVTGVRRRELLYQLVAANDGDEVERTGAILSTRPYASHFDSGSGSARGGSLGESSGEKDLDVEVEEVEVEMEVELEHGVDQGGAMEIEEEL